MWSLSPIMTYLVIINIVGFALYLIDTLRHRFTPEGQIDALITIVSLLGGSFGIVLSILIFDPKAVKENMMFRVFVSCMLVIQIILFLVLRGHYADHLTLAFWTFFDTHRILLAYLVIINLVTFAAFAIDKIAAIEHRFRIRIITLLTLSFIGGSLGGIIAMYLFDHKTQKDYFTVGIPLIMLMQAVILIYAMNVAW